MGFSYENSYYKVVSGPTWRKAQANAESIGGNLVSINSKKEEDVLHFIQKKAEVRSGRFD